MKHDLTLQETPFRRLFLALLLFVSHPVWAAVEVEELQSLDFGTVAITGNTGVSSLAISRSGVVDVEGDVLVVARASSGRYQLSGFPPNTRIEVDAETAVLTAGGTGFPEPLTLADYESNGLRSNEVGEAVLQLGGVLRTNGNSGSYVDAPYEGVTSLRFHWFEPEVGAFVSTNKDITPVARVQTSLVLEQVKALDFGAVYAQAASGEQASLTLAPDGKFTTLSPGNARIGSISAPQPAVIAVRGGAPRSQLQIVPASDPVLLNHATLSGAPHFILHSITTDPSGSATTDLDGKLAVSVGATLQTEDADNTQPYPNGVYEGQYEISITY